MLPPAEKDLMHAVKVGDHDGALKAIAAGASLEARDRFGYTPLMWAVMRQRAGLVDTLLARGADVRARDLLFGYTALHFAAEGPSIEITSALLRAGAEVDAEADTGDTPFEMACRAAIDSQVNLLLPSVAKSATVNRHGRTPLFVALYGRHFATAEKLIAAGVDLNQRNECGNSQLMHFAYWKSPDIVAFLLSHHADLSLRDSAGFSAHDLAKFHLDDYEQGDDYEANYARTLALFETPTAAQSPPESQR